MEKLELVVARFMEDLQWLRRVPKRFQIAVYNKGAPLDALPRRRNLTVTALPNTGREEQAYLRHIVDRYDDLADVTVFAQGKPFDHVPSFHRTLHQIAFHQLAVDDFLWLGFIIDEDDAEGARLFQSWSKNPAREPLPFDAFHRALFNEPAPERVSFFPSAHFAVTADCIRSRPRDVYERALRVSADLPHAGHCFERAWDRIFGVNGIPPEYRDGPRPTYLRKIRRLSS